MLKFSSVKLSDRDWVRECVSKTDFRGCEYSFATSYMWSQIFDIQIARHKGFYLSKYRQGFLFPAGCTCDDDIAEAVSVLREYCRENALPLKFINADKASAEALERLYGSQIETTTNRDYYDYVYDFESLATLRGRKLHSKRNHYHRFCEHNWSFEAITPDNIEEVTAMHNKWCELKGVYDDPDKLREAGAVIRGLDSFFELGFVGGVIRVDGEICAYTFGSAIGNRENDTFAVHVEKAFADVQGIYAAINKEFVNTLPTYKYINREEDMGAENLRKAKLSYRPAFLLDKYRITF
ncbi:MAG: phosphatidylglycerol lysyltransferase domain-containing protein [Oscillospiraceae bacterium]|nr:phosphatidylglycerol lysyltransferase domain-containing protein [Oscillospiraceae bacterium]